MGTEILWEKIKKYFKNFSAKFFLYVSIGPPGTLGAQGGNFPMEFWKILLEFDLWYYGAFQNQLKDLIKQLSLFLLRATLDPGRPKCMAPYTFIIQWFIHPLEQGVYTHMH